ncbi:hypothetical protein B0T14DRAFT_532018 [Immersiella caudata]|uniref:Uncharacterized protein n=1 Tax=Immersiella caudata TaxID=314043 RepID=A0AA39TG64_9PEZI|nr:hypothetical protein B0T14DRAFT_532018 [Immersiella caudata]
MFDPTIREKENFLPRPEAPGTIKMDRLPFSQDPLLTVLPHSRELQEVSDAAWGLANRCRDRYQMQQDNVNGQLTWRLAVCAKFITKHWQLGDARDIRDFIPGPTDTPLQKQRRLRHYRRRLFAHVMSADFPPEDEMHFWTNGSEQDVEQRLRDFVNITCDGDAERANAALRERSGRPAYTAPWNTLQERGSGRIYQPRLEDWDHREPLVRLAVLPPPTVSPSFFTNFRPEVSYCPPQQTVAEARPTEQRSMLAFR